MFTSKIRPLSVFPHRMDNNNSDALQATLVCRLLAKYNRATRKPMITAAGVVVPLSWLRTVPTSHSIHMDAVFITALVVRFLVNPIVKAPFQWSVINPME